LVIEIKPFKPVGQDDQSGVDNQAFWFRRSCERVQQACAMGYALPRPKTKTQADVTAIVW
jgi:hypothetical protein